MSARAEGLDVRQKYEEALVQAAIARHGLTLDREPDGKIVEAILIDASKVILPGDFSLLKPVPVLSHYTLFNYLHVRTRDQVIAREMLIKVGQRYDRNLVDESGRNLRSFFILSVARIVPVKGSAPDRVGLLVVTKDQWSLRLNTNFTFDQARLDTLSFSISENNVAGRNKTIAFDFALDPGKYTVGASYTDPRIWGSRHAFAGTADFFLNRKTGQYEGLYVTGSIGRPLFSLHTKWAWAAQGTYTKQIVRFFRGGTLGGLKFGSTVIPDEYQAKLASGSLEGTRSFGLTNKVNLSAGLSVSSSQYSRLEKDVAGLSPYERAVFAANLPWSEDAFGPYVRLEAFHAEYITLKNINTFALTEDYRLGPSVSLTAHYSLPGIFSHYLTLTGAVASLHYAHDNLFSVAASMTGRIEESVPNAPLVNQLISGSIYEVTPKFSVFRVHIKGQFQFREHDLFQTRTLLGSDVGLRGFAPRAIEGSSLYMVNAEIRTLPLNLWSVHVGAVAFYDGGDAPPDLRTLSWHQDAGVGLRILFPQFDRDVFRLDLAFPLEVPAGGYVPRFSAEFGQAF